jgi:hypothetical protein
MKDESNIRAIFRSTSPLRKPAALLGMLWVVLAFPVVATWDAREDFVRAIRELVGVLKS